VLRLMFAEAHPYPRTSVGNNLSDLSRRQPERIYTIVQELVESKNANSAWIAHRACRNLVKTDPRRVMDLLGIEEYHYKDRHYFKKVRS
jgi:3-methyladenine DNA glycosylase AlkC